MTGLMSAIDQVLGPDTSDDSQSSGLKDLSLEEASLRGSERPLSQEETPARNTNQAEKKKKKKAPKKGQKGAQQALVLG